MSDKSLIANFSGDIPKNYHTYIGPLMFEFSGADIARRVADNVNGPVKVLEVACGTGIATRHLANTLPEGSEIIATDLNEGMLTFARKVNGDLRGVTYQQADAIDLSFDDAEFDIVVCQFGIMFFPDKSQGMSEMTRVLKPGGMLALNVWDSLEQNPAVKTVDGIVKQFFEADPPRFLEAPFAFSDVEAAKQLFHDEGYEEVTVSYVSERVETTDYALPARGYLTGSPLIFEINERATVSVDEIMSATVDALEQQFGPLPAKLPYQEIVYTALKPLN